MTQPTNEKWLPVVGYEGFYEVSDHGRIRSIDRVVTGTDGVDKRVPGKMKSTYIHKTGYLNVRLTKHGVGKQAKVHRLVLEAFVGPCPEGMEGCHNNGDRKDAQLANLRWDTRSANALDRVKHGNHNTAHNTHCPRGHILSEPNLVRATSKEGRRACLACARARARVHYASKRKGVDISHNLQAIADEYFKAICRSEQTRVN